MLIFIYTTVSKNVTTFTFFIQQIKNFTVFEWHGIQLTINNDTQKPFIRLSANEVEIS